MTTTTTTPFPLTAPTAPDAAAQFEQLTSDWDVVLGVRVSYIGEDGDMVVLGHHDDRRTVAALNAYNRSFSGEAIDDTYDRAAGNLSRPWARFLTTCDDAADHARQVADGGECPSCRQITNADGWWMAIGSKPDDPTAFPITHWTTS